MAETEGKFTFTTETVTLVDSWHSERLHQDIYRLRRARDGRVADVRESSLRGYDGMTPQGVKARLQAGETVEVEIGRRTTEPYHWTQNDE